MSERPWPRSSARQRASRSVIMHPDVETLILAAVGRHGQDQQIVVEQVARAIGTRIVLRCITHLVRHGQLRQRRYPTPTGFGRDWIVLEPVAGEAPR